MGTRLDHKTALVTGATSNIGRAIFTAFAAEGAHAIVTGRSDRRGAEVVEEIRDVGGRAEFIAAELDGSAKASGNHAIAATRALGGHIDVLVNNVGIFPGPSAAATDEATFDQVYAVNVKVPVCAEGVIRRRRGERARFEAASARPLGQPPTSCVAT